MAERAEGEREAGETGSQGRSAAWLSVERLMDTATASANSRTLYTNSMLNQ